MMIRQNHKQDALPSAGMPGPADPLLLTSRAKAALIHAGGSGVRPLSKNNRLSLTPGLHLSAAPAQHISALLKPSSSSSSSCSSSSALPAAQECSESQRESENFPPRRPLKLAPLELPLEVKEAQWQKMHGIQQEVKMSARKLEATGGEPCPRKVKACGTDGGAKAPARPPLTTIMNPYKLQQRAGRALRLPVHQLQLGDDDRPAGKEAGHKERSSVPAAKSAHVSPAGQSGRTKQMVGQSACAEQTCGQSAVPEVQDAGSRRRPRLRRAPRLEEDQSKSGSSTGGLCAEEGKPGLAGTGPGQRSTEKALQEASRVLEKASRRNQPGTTPTSGAEDPTAWKFSRRMAVSDIQEAAL